MTVPKKQTSTVQPEDTSEPEATQAKTGITNQTGGDLLWQGQVFLQGEKVPEAIAIEMNLSAINQE